MWVFLATEVLFFGTLFLGLTIYHSNTRTRSRRGAKS